jgi:hypothetical protein
MTTKPVNPNKVVFIQTFNNTTKGWSCPSRWDDKEPTWRDITVAAQKRLARTPNGFKSALWRVRAEMLAVKNNGLQVWNCSRVKQDKEQAHTINGLEMRFTVWTFSAQRVKRDMTGGI